MTNFIAIGYHGSKDELSKKKLDFNYMQYKDHFLGRGFYIFRDSFITPPTNNLNHQYSDFVHNQGSFLKV